jgi:hypothetical protein
MPVDVGVGIVGGMAGGALVGMVGAVVVAVGGVVGAMGGRPSPPLPAVYEPWSPETPAVPAVIAALPPLLIVSVPLPRDDEELHAPPASTTDAMTRGVDTRIPTSAAREGYHASGRHALNG